MIKYKKIFSKLLIIILPIISFVYFFIIISICLFDFLNFSWIFIIRWYNILLMNKSMIRFWFLKLFGIKILPKLWLLNNLNLNFYLSSLNIWLLNPNFSSSFNLKSSWVLKWVLFSLTLKYFLIWKNKTIRFI